MNQTEYQEILEACGGSYEQLSGEGLRSLLHEWREAYAAGLFAATGRWKLGPYEWHVFSFEHAQALNGDRAVSEYLAQPVLPVVVYPEGLKLPGVRLTGARFPDFGERFVDVHIWPESLDWTMAFTHERSLGLGPYFSRREWMVAGETPDRGESRKRGRSR